MQAELACLVLHFLSEDLSFFDTVDGKRNQLHAVGAAAKPLHSVAVSA
jgi:hypothetical protein